MLKYWNDGKTLFFISHVSHSLFHYRMTPSFHYSNIPFSQLKVRQVTPHFHLFPHPSIFLEPSESVVDHL